MRLAGAKRQYKGRVELYIEGRWGTVCDRGWGINEANVVCRQLGYTKATQAFKGGTFGPGNGTIWLTELGCTGNETSLLTCNNAKAHLGNTSCDHVQDAGVECDSTKAGELAIFNFTI